ncbi:MAG: putative metal-dependent hydrolase [Oleispira sp.]|jgi:predicted metal-dependent hydrolase
MRDLIQWRALEDIEYKTIAFDVYQASNGNEMLRTAGYVNAMLFIHLTSSSMVTHFLLKDGYSKK